MGKDEFAAVVKGALAQSVQFVDTELSFERARATEFYLGKPFGNEEDGRSQVVMTDVRDAVDGMLPSLMRVFFGSEHAVELVPSRADTVEQAQQATDYIRYVIEEDNKGFLRMYSVFKDALIRKIGIVKWWWDTSETTRAYRMEGLDDQQMQLLASDDDVTLTKVVKRKDDQGQEVHDVDLTRTQKGGRPAFEELPPEEWIFNRQAREMDDALLVAHRTDKTRGELLAMGIKAKDIDEYAGAGSASTDVTLAGNAEEIARRDVAGVGRVVGFGYTNDPEMGKANAKILYTEAWMTIDYDGDGIAELRRICCIGPSYAPVVNEPTSERPFAIGSPYPEPHTMLGGSVADRTMDIQKIDSSLLRGTLDSLSASIFPRTAYQEGAVNVPDIMNTAIGAPIRVRGDVNAAIRPIEVPFTGKEALSIIQFMQDVVERRTGRNKGVAGLDSDALQSTGKEAVGAVLTGSQEQLEMIARLFAEQLMKPLVKGIYRMLVTHQPKERVVRLRGQWVTVDPRAWDQDMDVTVNVALGSTFTDKKVATLMAVASDQKDIITTMGPMNPMVTLAQLRNTKAKILTLQGLKDVDSYYQPIDPNWQPPPQPAPPPDPAMLSIQAEKEMSQMKVVKELAIKQDEIALQTQQQEWQQDFDVRKWAADVELKKYAIDAQFHGTMTQAMLDHNIETEKSEAELTLNAHDQLHDQSLEADAQAHSQVMDQQAADTADQQAQAQTQPQQPTDGGGGGP